MRFFNSMDIEKLKGIFHILPEFFDRDNNKEVLSYTLGATLYTPATKVNLIKSVQKYGELMSSVICLEDSIGDNEVEMAETYLVDQFMKLYDMVISEQIEYQDIPLLFIRVRNKEQMNRLIDNLDGAYKLITGFVFPKFNKKNGHDYFNALRDLNKRMNKTYYSMPILESEDIMFKDLRSSNLENIREIFELNKDLVLNIRIGAADFCRQFGIRRNYNSSIYDISVVNDCISDIINYFSRQNNFIISGPVWEYYNNMENELDYIDLMAEHNLNDNHYSSKSKLNLIDAYTLGLIKETIKDKENGLLGKTIIHPSQISPVQSVYIVSYEEYMDAVDIIENSTGNIGVLKSIKTNKMNEVKTHYNWAKKVINRAKFYGVYNDKQKRSNLLA
ncbi:MAG: HpcH/HpaI aldolase/citrate lyase family protein [Clostridiales bacterium]